MYINFGENLFMPEGDDFSKNEFDKDSEEILSEGNAILQKLRAQQELKQIELPEPTSKEVTKPDKNVKKENENLSFKEIFNSVAASK